MDENYRYPIKALAAINEAVREKQTIYINGICGMGKTALVKKYFEGKEYDYYCADGLNEDTLSRYENISEDSIVVIDDLQFLAYETECDVRKIQKKIIELVYNNRVQLVLVSRGKIIAFVLGDYGKAVVDLALAESWFEKGESSKEIIKLADRGQIKAQATGKMEQEFVAINIISLMHLINGNRDESLVLMKKHLKRQKDMDL